MAVGLCFRDARRLPARMPHARRVMPACPPALSHLAGAILLPALSAAARGAVSVKRYGRCNNWHGDWARTVWWQRSHNCHRLYVPPIRELTVWQEWGRCVAVEGGMCSNVSLLQRGEYPGAGVAPAYPAGVGRNGMRTGSSSCSVCEQRQV